MICKYMQKSAKNIKQLQIIFQCVNALEFGGFEAFGILGGAEGE